MKQEVVLSRTPFLLHPHTNTFRHNRLPTYSVPYFQSTLPACFYITFAAAPIARIWYTSTTLAITSGGRQTKKLEQWMPKFQRLRKYLGPSNNFQFIHQNSSRVILLMRPFRLSFSRLPYKQTLFWSYKELFHPRPQILSSMKRW